MLKYQHIDIYITKSEENGQAHQSSVWDLLDYANHKHLKSTRIARNFIKEFWEFYDKLPKFEDNLV